ncbi:hypothetical protein K470DRAFT_209518 [Piedraia hortae CBS 480.64]|uniref:Uncharacterized protein n=1 Tax=Piedraia hortae CBS 480.64 TaxID=1314780 RepID=A0A6A7CAB9_9PEZI|nr:hypothetical protein K470DRAFT_209518 [Piedraia hortae CBS 480.64]
MHSQPQPTRAHAGSVANAAAALVGSPAAIHQTIHETTAKRVKTVDYLRRLHQGDVFHFKTLHFSTASIQHLPSCQPHKLGRRATNYFFLGYSLPLLLDLYPTSPLEYLKALAALLHEFDSYQTITGSDGSSGSLSRAKVGLMLKSHIGLANRSGIRTSRRVSAATTESVGTLDSSRSHATSPPSENSLFWQDVAQPPSLGLDFQYLLTPPLPFDPDFNTTFSTFCLVLEESYSHLLSLLADPDSCTPAVGEAYAKADKAVRKILIQPLVREIEENTRQGIKTEFANLGKLVIGGLA